MSDNIERGSSFGLFYQLPQDSKKKELTWRQSVYNLFNFCYNDDISDMEHGPNSARAKRARFAEYLIIVLICLNTSSVIIESCLKPPEPKWYVYIS